MRFGPSYMGVGGRSRGAVGKRWVRAASLSAGRKSDRKREFETTILSTAKSVLIGVFSRTQELAILLIYEHLLPRPTYKPSFPRVQMHDATSTNLHTPT
jgi:hypothetical protein